MAIASIALSNLYFELRRYHRKSEAYSLVTKKTQTNKEKQNKEQKTKTNYTSTKYHLI